MQSESGVEDIVNTVERFRILCVGRAGVGKSSLINRVFRLGPSAEGPIIEDSTPGEANIDKEFISPENKLFVLHDSKGFESGNENTFRNVTEFIQRRRVENLPLKEQLHAVWLCTEMPTAGGRAFETGDENLLQLAHQTETPIVVVFTKFDKLLESKRLELKEDNENLVEEVLDNQCKVEADKVHDVCVESLKSVVSAMKPPVPEPSHVIVSDRPNYEFTIESLVTVTRNLVRNQPRVMWEVAQRASLRVKIEGCIDNSLRDVKIKDIKLADCLSRVYQNVVPYWNFVDQGKTLSSEEFKHLMLCLVQDIQDPQNLDGSHTTAGTMSAPLGLNPSFKEWLSNVVLNDDVPPAQRVLVAYTTDLITVLQSLFIKVTRSSSTEAPKITSRALNEVYQAHKQSDPRRQIYRRISGQPPGCDKDNIRNLLRELLGYEPMSPPDQESKMVAASPSPTGITTSPPPIGVNAPSHSNGMATLSSPAGVAASSPQSNEVPAARAQTPPQSTSPPIWHRLCPCLAPPPP